MLKRSLIAATVIFLALAALFTQATAAGMTVRLKGHFWKKAKGEAVVKDSGPGQKEITITAAGLKPNGVYTVWLVNKKPKMEMAGLGSGDYSFKADKDGGASYTAVVSSSELERWQAIKVAYHPDNDPKNMKGVRSALIGWLKK